ncbi:unnamed protein product (macronuclear) [Paramecium tetraurelia]|uniref:Phosphatidylinositol-4-phosphate 5-kinase n=1 Tax=Paramecium tetraurelia TaxID=5888 RepID=A0DSC8_PARTE|nr:uncharacterized protein GSPATT00019649001 [Paramecium tetraurelia]CAK85945.1 unnamed protein product [Paramecium tetraurelia]|eukprot:XP_001453342.1 hypothetical protein (macronuclear) [Paramecium tetraurelia strain d4-2]
MCCSRKQKTNNQREEINKLGKLTRLTEIELIELKTRFARMSQGSNFVTKFQFRDNLGLLGMGTMLHLSDRIFHIMDDDKDGKIRFEDFALYFDKVSHGDAREKAEISFKLIDKNKIGSFTSTEFNDTMQGVINSWIAMTGQNLTSETKKQIDQRIKLIFSTMDVDKADRVTLQQYQDSVVADPALLEIFDFARRGVTLESIDYSIYQQQKYVQNIEKKLDQLLEFMKQDNKKQEKELPHFVQGTVEQEQKLRNSQVDNLHSPIISLFKYDSEENNHNNNNDHQGINKFFASDQIPSVNYNQFNELSIEHLKNDQNQDFSFYAQSKPKRKFKALFQQIPQKQIEGDNQDPLEEDQFYNTEKSFESDHDQDESNQFVEQMTTDQLKEKYKSMITYVTDISKEVQRLRELIDQNQIKQQKMDIIDQINEQRLHTIINVPRKTQSIKNQKQTKKPKISVSFGHENFNLVLNMMIGIQMAVSSINVADDYEVGPKDFKLKYYFELLPRRAQGDKSSFKVCQFFDYAPRVFNSIRTIYGIDNHQYLKSIGPESILQSLIKGDLSCLQELTSTGKSGSFFYYTADGQFTLKTIHHQEFRFLKQIMRNYYYHLKNYPETLIIKLFGMHKIGIKYQTMLREKVIYFVIMSNVFSTNQEINVRYDLKGSTYGRYTIDNDPTVARKDLNFLEDKEKNMRLNINKNKSMLFFNQLEKDCKFFEDNDIIDYSLLLGLHAKGNKQLDNESSVYSENPQLDNFSKMVTVDNQYTLHIGIIDILTNFSTKKKLEFLSKRVIYGPTISAIPPRDYAERFLKFLKDHLFAN